MARASCPWAGVGSHGQDPAFAEGYGGQVAHATRAAFQILAVRDDADGVAVSKEPAGKARQASHEIAAQVRSKAEPNSRA